MKRTICTAFVAALWLTMGCLTVQATEQYVVSYTENTRLTLFGNPTTVDEQTSYYRIPAITKLGDGTLLAFSDLRIGGTKDIGGGNAISIVCRRSADCGQTWDEQQVAIAGGGEEFDFAHGDAAVITDSETGKTLLLCASGTRGYAAGGCMLGQYYSEDGTTWTGGDITSVIQEAFAEAGLTIKKQFFTSGRIIQSSKVKVGSSYRIYSALCTGNGSVVVCSDDFGQNWAVLGGVVACKGGDETVLEELPNGDLLLSARLSSSGRKFNVFSYSDLATATGAWNDTTPKGLNEATNCNAEMLLLPTDKENLFVLLHSVALAGRTNVTIYYRVIDTTVDPYNTPSFYEEGWRVLQQMSTTTSCYSTMVLDNEGNVAYLFEENSDGGYDIQYRNFSIEVSESTGIETLTREDEQPISTTAEYNLHGQRMAQPLTGSHMQLSSVRGNIVF